MDNSLINNQLEDLLKILKNEINPSGFWTGELSPSALAVAVSIVALKKYDEIANSAAIKSGLLWLCGNINKDGGYGDTPRSISNLSTTMLSYSAIRFCSSEEIETKHIIYKIEKYLSDNKIVINSENLSRSILDYYGKDYTFSVPILSMLHICGISGAEAVEKIPLLPFELALIPQKYYRFFNLHVVSYAIPALIAMGIYVFKNRKRKVLILKYLKQKSIISAIEKLFLLLPESGGFLEAVPLTSFVCMCLISSGFKEHEPIEKLINFIKKLQRPDGSWPIDTDLSTWVTTLSIKALGTQLNNYTSTDQRNILRQHLLNCQYNTNHAFNDAAPGGWGWTNFSGSVPDADDTSGAILALLKLHDSSEEVNISLIKGCKWLINLQNNDGGFPTFCKGWGKLPFDSSCADITSHALSAIALTVNKVKNQLTKNEIVTFSKSLSKACNYLKKYQRPDGSWVPLWFGNQYTAKKENPVYGTSRVSIYLQDCIADGALPKHLETNVMLMLEKAFIFLQKAQNPDGSWGMSGTTSGTIEETALSVSALSKIDKAACLKAVKWLAAETSSKGLYSSPIGLYFATLWYDEKLYPLIFYIEALIRLININN